MSLTVSTSPLATSAAPSAPVVLRTWPLWLALGALVVLWADLIRQLSYVWSNNEEYGFGWFVPLLALGLLWKQWPTRPALRIQPSPLWFVGLVVALGSLLLPLRVVHEVNQDWALVCWLLTLSVVALSLYGVFLLGGWPWVIHFAFPVCFIFVAVRWPYRIENSLTYRLQGLVSALTVQLLGWLSVPAAQHGNLIEVASGTVGVDEACSGIRSFQSSLMFGLFIGAYYRLSLRARIAVVLGGLTLAFGSNVFRTLFLTWQANAHGVSAIDKWHDPAGLITTLISFFALWALALVISCKSLRSPQNEDRGESALPHLISDLRSLTSSRAFPRFFPLALAVWIPCVIAANEAWYHSHDSNQAVTATWWVNLPANSPGAQEIPISRLAREKLRYDKATTLAWDEPDGSKWSVYCMQWNAGAATSRLAARDHRPEYCLGGSGYKCQADLGIRYLPVQGLELPFREYVFETSGTLIYVFHCLWENGAVKQTGFGNSKYLDRLESVLQGKRRLGQQTLELIISGYQDMPMAEMAVRQRLPTLIRLEAEQDKTMKLVGDQQ